MSYLLDTCLLSELPKTRPNAGVAAWIRATDESLYYVSVLTLGELRKGVAKLAGGQRKDAIQAWLEQDVIDRFQNRILSVDLEICMRWGRLSADSERLGQPRPVLDTLLASTALTNDLVLVTRNERDFMGTGARILNPWT